jgi:hypothetical protein
MPAFELDEVLSQILVREPLKVGTKSPSHPITGIYRVPGVYIRRLDPSKRARPNTKQRRPTGDSRKQRPVAGGTKQREVRSDYLKH